jgi:hypothetical protein
MYRIRTNAPERITGNSHSEVSAMWPSVAIQSRFIGPLTTAQKPSSLSSSHDPATRPNV